MINYYPRDFSRNADNKISVDIDYVDSKTGITVSKTFDFDNDYTNSQMDAFVKDNAPDQETFDDLKTEKDTIEAVDTRVEGLATAFKDKKFNV